MSIGSLFCDKGFSLRLTLSEMDYLIFGGKRCVRCYAKTIKEKKSEIVTGSVAEAGTRGRHMFASDAKVKRYYYTFTCPECGHVLTIGRDTDEI